MNFMNSIIKLITISFIIICTFSPVNAGIYDGLVAWYPFDGNANDVSGNGNHGVVHGAKLTIDRFGISNSAYSFDGESDFITVLDSDSLDCISAFTISAWISQFEITSASQTIAAKGRAVNGTGYRLGIYDTGTDLGLNNGSYNCSAIASHTINNTWINITGTWDGKIIKVYVNGLLLKQNDNCANTSLKNSSEPLNIGRETSELKRYFKGVIDDVRIYNRSLNITEVNELYRIDTMDLSNGLVAHYEFENNVKRINLHIQ